MKPTSRHAFERWDGRRIAAIAASVALHLALLVIVLGERATPIVVPERAIEVRVIADPRGSSAGAPTDDVRARAASSVVAPVAAPQVRAVTQAKRDSARPAKTDAPSVIAALVPPPAIDRPRFDEPGAGALASRESAPGSAPGDAGSGRHGSDESGSMRRIAFVAATKPSLDVRTAREARAKDAYAIVAVRIDVDGRPHDLRFLRASGFIAIDNAIRVATIRSRYTPHLENGKPIEFWAIIPYTFGNAHPDISGALASAGFGRT